MAREITSDIKKDPFIYNLFADETKHDFVSSRPVNWVKIPTSWTSEDENDTSISMLSVYTYSAEECKNISKYITDPTQIVFSDDGHLAVDFTTKSNTSAANFYPNPTVTENTGGTRPIGIANTVHMQNKNFTATFFYNEKILFSQNLKWILYKLPGAFYSKNKADKWSLTQNNVTPKSGDNSAPVYVLLYNTLHRSNFQELYGKILNLTKKPFDTSPFIGPNGNYINTMKKYCNAFKIKKYVSPSSGLDLFHYADPSCALAIDPQVAKLSQVLGLNLTQKTWEKKFYDKGLTGFNAAKEELKTVPISAPYCGRGSGDDPAQFLRYKAQVIRPAPDSTDSFMQILSNYQIASSSQSDANLPAEWDSSRIGRAHV